MRILYICKSLPHRFQGGIQSHVWQLSEWMTKLGHEVHILTAGSMRSGEKRILVENTIGQNEETAFGKRYIIEIPYIPGRKLPFVSIWAEELAFNMSAEAWLSRHHREYDVVHLQGRSGFLFAGKQHDTPVITTIHGLVSNENTKAGLNGVEKSWVVRQHEKWASYFERKTMQESDRVIAVSHALLNLMTAAEPQVEGRVAVIPNGVDIPEIPDNVEIDEKMLLFVGRLDPIKGLFPLVEAMRYVDNDVHLVVVGDGPARAEMEQRVQKASLESRIKFVGAQSATEVTQWLHKAFALILPSYFESMPVTLLEANACGKPVLASEVGGIPSIVNNGKNGWLFSPGKPEQMAVAINRLFANPDIACDMGNFGRKLMREKFSWEKIAHQTETVYKEAIYEKRVAKLPSLSEVFC